MNILVLNCGSSSLKFQLIATDLDRIEKNDDKRLAHGTIERIGGAAIITQTAEGKTPQRSAAPIRDMRSAVEMIVRWIVSDASEIAEVNGLGDIQAVGHRVVHGGEHFSESVIISDDILRGIEDCIELAPLHNPANISGIRAAREIFGKGIVQVAVFDTAFHQTLPEKSFLYALPYQLYRRHKIRRYGFHGTSNRYVAYRYRTLLNIPREQVNVIALHLGNGCSATAIKGGKSIDTSMGMTPLEGLVMGTRAGDFDPAIIDFVAAKEGLSALEIESLVNKQSGLLGLSGLTNDMRELLAESKENGDRRSSLAIEIFCYRASKYIGSYLAAMNGADALIFTGGIGENSSEVRRMICDYLSWFGGEVDSQLNESMTGGKEGIINTGGSRLKIFVIPTNEELLIARDTARLIGSKTSDG
ncbi:MAG TPA: acetate kinase [Pyrinomonadaceae bacterium]|nr:acetate kinase [Acidobacteriota bacterium]HQZ96279.1 acetate kinase [Pyrinomonadaceae bacterium]